MSHSKEIGSPPGHDSKFKQQGLPSLYPSHSAFMVSVALAACAICFIPIGAVVISATDSVHRTEIRYDQINRCTIFNNQALKTFNAGSDSSDQGCNTQAVFQLDKTLSAPIYIYYRIKGMYQNFRTYYDSRDDSQLMDGKASSLNSNCDPFRYPGQNGGAENTAFEYNPCGLIAWSMFNDTISLYAVPQGTTPGGAIPGTATPICIGGSFGADGESTTPHSCVKKGIALEVDREHRFKAPTLDANQWTGVGQGTEPYRSQGYYLDEPGHRLPITNDEDFMVWARSAAFPDFRKLYREITVDLQPGTYLLDIDEFFDVTRFDGEKIVMIATQSWLGGRHEVLGICMLAMGSLSFVLAVGFILHHILVEGRKAS